jgi:hypothetical protein
MHEFIILAESHGPLWLTVPGGSFEILNKMVYAQKFGGKNSTNVIGFKTEATRADAVVMMNAKNMMDYLMDTVSCIQIVREASYSFSTKKLLNLSANAIDAISSHNLILMLNDCSSAMHLSVLEFCPVQKSLRLTNGPLMQATMGLCIWYVCLTSL